MAENGSLVSSSLQKILRLDFQLVKRKRVHGSQTIRYGCCERHNQRRRIDGQQFRTGHQQLLEHGNFRSAHVTGGTGLTSIQMQQPGNFHLWDFANTWTIYNGLTNPLLRSFMTSLTVTAKDATELASAPIGRLPNESILDRVSFA